MDSRQREELIRAFNECDEDSELVRLEITVFCRAFGKMSSVVSCKTTVKPTDDNTLEDMGDVARESAEMAIREMIADLHDQHERNQEDDDGGPEETDLPPEAS